MPMQEIVKVCARCCRDVQKGEVTVPDPCCNDRNCVGADDVSHPGCIPTVRIVPKNQLI